MGVGPLFISRVIAFLVIVLFLSARAPAETFATLRGALEEVAAKYQIRVGLEYAAQDKDLQPITSDLSAKSVDTVLTQLINQKTDYAWSFADRVYDVYPKSNSDSILDVKIREFIAKKPSSKNTADLVGQIPEIKEWLITRSVSRREFQIRPSAPSPENWRRHPRRNSSTILFSK